LLAPEKYLSKTIPQEFQVMTNGKKIQMPLLPERTNHLERIPNLGQRQGQAEQMQEMRKEVHPPGEGHKMTGDSYWLDDMIASRDPGLALSIMQIVKDLKTFAKSTQSRIEELEKDPSPNQELILQEKTILESIQKEIRRLERKALYWELGA
jgi:hypothetical protein